MKPNLLFFDIDGTLLSETTHTIPQSTINALKLAKANGHLIFINTGRPISTIDQCIKDLNPDGYICGCGTYITYQNHVLYQYHINKQRCLDIVDLIDKHHLQGVLEGDQAVYFIHPVIHPEVLEFYQRYKDMGFDLKDAHDASLAFDKFAIWYKGNIQSFRENILQDFEIIDRSEEMLEIVPRGHSKATGIQYLVDYFHSDLDHCYVFGDSFNDESMLRYVPHSIVMKNGVKEMQEIAQFVTKDIENDGIAFAMKHYHLI